VSITDVTWVRDQHGRRVLELKIDGRQAHIRSSQKTELVRRGILDGIVFLASERAAQVPGTFVRGDFTPAYQGLDLVGCTDDPRVFALYEDMCQAIRDDRWHEGPRPTAS